MSNNNVPNDGLVDRTKLHLTIMKHNGMPDLAVKNWAAIAADMGLSVATVKQQFGKDKKAFHASNQAGPPPAPVIKRRNRNKQNVAAANDDNEEVEDEGNLINVPAAPAVAASSTRTRKARGSNRNVAAASAHSDNDSVDEVNDNSVNNPAPWQPQLALLVLLVLLVLPILSPRKRSGKQRVVDAEDDESEDENVAAIASLRTPAAHTTRSTLSAGTAVTAGAAPLATSGPVTRARGRRNQQRVADNDGNDSQNDQAMADVPAGPAATAPIAIPDVASRGTQRASAQVHNQEGQEADRSQPRHWQRWFALGSTKEGLAESRRSRGS
ncbi:hypothetical protein PG990_013209 [Apiospora arundinis]